MRKFYNMKRRTNWEIILDILNEVYAKRKSNKTRIMQGTHLDGRAFQKYFHHLLEEGLIEKNNPDIEFYELTEDGMRLLNKLREVDMMITHSLKH